MGDSMLPAAILLYIAGATSVTNLLVNGIRNAVTLPAIVAFLGACVVGWGCVLLLMLANGVELNTPLWAASVIAGIMVGGASAGSNALHGRAKPTDPPLEAPPEPAKLPTAEEIAEAVERRMNTQGIPRPHTSELPRASVGPPPAPTGPAPYSELPG